MLTASLRLSAQCSVSFSSGGPFCPGSVTLHATTLGSAASSHQWYDASGNTISSTGGYVYSNPPTNTSIEAYTSSITVSLSQSTFYKVQPSCTSSKTQLNVTISGGSPVSIAITPSTTNVFDLCVGDNVTLTPGGGSGYSWTYNGSSTGGSGALHPTVSGLYTLTGLNSACGISTSSSVTLSFNPTISGLSESVDTLNICQGATISHFNVTASHSPFFNWTLTATGKSDTQIGTIALTSTTSCDVSWNPAFSGAATVGVTANGCNGTTAGTSLSMTVYALPSVASTPSGSVAVPFGSTFRKISVPLVSGTTYAWKQNGSDKPDSTHSYYYVRDQGTYVVTATSSIGCQATSVPVIVSFENSFNLISENVLLTDIKSNGQPIKIKSVDSLGYDRRMRKNQYVDGLGNPMQTVQVQASPGYHDIITPTSFDVYGREPIKYLPFSQGNTGWFHETGSVLDAQADFYNDPTSKVAVDSAAYAVTEFEPSPLDRVFKQGAPGKAWQPDGDYTSFNDHAVKIRYWNNADNEVLLLVYDPVTGQLNTRASSIYYAHGQLSLKRTLNEHNNEILEYTDKMGHMVCKKVQYAVDGSSKKVYASTYYVYDDYGNLAVVLPPEGVKEFIRSISAN